MSDTSSSPHATSLSLRDLERCFRGVVPSSIATCAPDGIPNITYLSIVHAVDDTHVATSYQFFNKSRENILVQPRAQILVVDAQTTEQYRLDVHYERTEIAGPLFERLRTNLDAVAAYTGMTGIFRLRGADIYRVLGIEALAHDLDLRPLADTRDLAVAFDSLSTRLETCDDLDAVLDAVTHSLADDFGFLRTMIFLADGPGSTLFLVTSHGYTQSGIGAEVPVGEGLIGVAARERRPVRVSSFQREAIMAAAVRSTAQTQGLAVDPPREIRLPGLGSVESQLAVPIVAQDRLLGVVCVQSTQQGRFTSSDEHALATVARLLASAMRLLDRDGGHDSPAQSTYAAPTTVGPDIHVRHYPADDAIFLDGEYLIKGLSGRIFHRLLRAFERDGRVDFTLKELRADENLQSGRYRDNLDARLLLLRRRLEEHSASIRLVKTGRGRFRLDVSRPLTLETS